MSARKYNYDFHTSWFGGEEETRKAVVELQDRTADKLNMRKGGYVINEHHQPWIVTLWFLPNP